MFKINNYIVLFVRSIALRLLREWMKFTSLDQLEMTSNLIRIKYFTLNTWTVPLECSPLCRCIGALLEWIRTIWYSPRLITIDGWIVPMLYEIFVSSILIESIFSNVMYFQCSWQQVFPWTQKLIQMHWRVMFLLSTSIERYHLFLSFTIFLVQFLLWSYY